MTHAVVERTFGFPMLRREPVMVDDTPGDEEDEDTVTVDSRNLFDSVGDVHLVVLSGPDAGERRTLGEQESLSIGRSDGADLTLEDAGISKRHALFTNDVVTTVEDLSSSNGTFVNGERIDEPKQLESGDTIGLGASCLIQFGTNRQEMAARAESDAAGAEVLRVGADGNWFECAAGVVDLRDRESVRRIFRRLVELSEEDEEYLHAYDLLPVGWPGETVSPDEARERVHGVIEALRDEGLDEILRSTPSDYEFAPGFYLDTEAIELRRYPDQDAPPS